MIAAASTGKKKYSHRRRKSTLHCSRFSDQNFWERKRPLPQSSLSARTNQIAHDLVIAAIHVLGVQNGDASKYIAVPLSSPLQLSQISDVPLLVHL